MSSGTEKDPSHGFSNRGILNQQDKRAAFLDNKDKDNWEEKPYPYNQVTVTRSGHIFEFDNSKDKERIHMMHCSGSGYEYLRDGTKLEHNVGNEWKYGKGGRTETYQRGQDAKVKGYHRRNQKGSHHEYAEDNSRFIGRHSASFVGGNSTHMTKGQMHYASEHGGSFGTGTGSDAKIRMTWEKGKGMHLTSDKDLTIEAPGKITLKAGSVISHESQDHTIDCQDLRIEMSDNAVKIPWRNGAAFAPPGPGRIRLPNDTKYHDGAKSVEKGFKTPNYGTTA